MSSDFSWDTFLSETSAEIAPASLFDHVNRSFDILLKPEHYIEAKHVSGVWWPAEIVSVSRYVVNLNWCKFVDNVNLDVLPNSGKPHPTGSFWLNFKAGAWEKIRYLDLSRYKKSDGSNPLIVRNIFNDSFILIPSKIIPKTIMDNKILYGYDSVKTGNYVDCQHEYDTNTYWPAKVLQNFGGLLVLKWFGADNKKDVFLLHYQHRRVQPLGYVEKMKTYSHSLKYESPYRSMTKGQVDALKINRLVSAFAIEKCISNAKWSDNVLRYIRYGSAPQNFSLNSLRRHEFKVGWRLEAINPKQPFFVQPATVTKIFDDYHFLVELDDMRKNASGDRIKLVGQAGLADLMPVNTSIYKGIQLRPPFGWDESEEFVWTQYLARMILNSDMLVNSSKDLNSPSVVDGTNNVFQTQSYRNKYPCCPEEYFFRGIQPPGVLKRNFSSDNAPIFKAKTAEFLLGMKLEIMLRFLKDLYIDKLPPICTATVVRVKGKLLWVLPDICTTASACIHPQIGPVLCDPLSMDLYPMGWSYLVNYKAFYPPTFYCNPRSILSNFNECIEELRKEDKFAELVQSCDLEAFRNSTFTSSIYINSSCFTGRFLHKKLVLRLPRKIGPGPISNVLCNLIQLLVKASHKPVATLRLFEADWLSNLAMSLTNSSSSISTADDRTFLFDKKMSAGILERHEGMNIVMVKVRCPRKGNQQEYPVEICKRLCAMEEFCRQVCLLLEACPFFITLYPVKQPNKFVPMQLTHLSQDDVSVLDCPAYCNVRNCTKHLERIPSWRKRLYIAFNQSHLGGLDNVIGASSSKQTEALSKYDNSTVYCVPPMFRVFANNNTNANGNNASSGVTNSGRILRTRSYSNLPSTNEVATRLPTDTNDEDKLVPEYKSNADAKCTQLNEVKLSQNKKKLLENGITNNSVAKSVRHVVDIRHYHSIVSDFVDVDPLDFFTEEGSKKVELNWYTTLCFVPLLELDTNPLYWNSVDVSNYILNTDCSDMQKWLLGEAVDGQSFMLLTLSVLHETVNLDWPDAIRLGRHILALKYAFMNKFYMQKRDDVMLN